MRFPLGRKKARGQGRQPILDLTRSWLGLPEMLRWAASSGSVLEHTLQRIEGTLDETAIRVDRHGFGSVDVQGGLVRGAVKLYALGPHGIRACLDEQARSRP